MTPSDEPRKVDLKRWRDEIIGLIEQFPRQYRALESAMATFGDDFDLKQFKQAFESEDMEIYNRVQAVERGLGRVQNFVVDLAVVGVKLAQVPVCSDTHVSAAQRALEGLRDADVISAELCRRAIRAQRARSTIEHSYIETPAGDVHAAATLVHQTARGFMARYRPWIAQHLD